MTLNEAAKTAPLKDFLVKDYELKVCYPTDHFGRMWTRFNYFVGIESALVRGKLIFGNGTLSPEVAIIGALVSLMWYVMGAEDRFLVRVYRRHVQDAAGLLTGESWNSTAFGPYRHVGEVAESSKSLGGEISGWRWKRISTTRLAAYIPLIALVGWIALLISWGEPL